MARMTAEMKKLVNKGVAYIATVDEKGMPNVAPKGSCRAIDDDTVSFSEGFGKKTFENLRRNPKVSVGVVGPSEGYQFKGTAIVLTEGPEYEAAREENLKRGRGAPVAVVTIKIEEIYSVWPAYRPGERVD